MKIYGKARRITDGKYIKGYIKFLNKYDDYFIEVGDTEYCIDYKTFKPLMYMCDNCGWLDQTHILNNGRCDMCDGNTVKIHYSILKVLDRLDNERQDLYNKLIEKSNQYKELKKLLSNSIEENKFQDLRISNLKNNIDEIEVLLQKGIDNKIILGIIKNQKERDDLDNLVHNDLKNK